MAASELREVFFVQPEGPVSLETGAAASWLRSCPDVRVAAVPVGDLPDALAGVPVATVWFHWSEPPALSEAVRHALEVHVRAGGGLLATLAAAMLPVQLGWEDVAPDEAADAAWTDEPEDELAREFSQPQIKRGLQSFRGHPLFEGLGSGCYSWAPIDGERIVRYAYTGETWPKQGRVIAVSKSFIAMNPDRRLAWEYMVGDGWALCIGGYVYFAASDPRFRPQLEHLMRNALERAAPNGGRARLLGGEWRRPVIGLELDPKVPLPPELPGDANAAFELGQDIALEREAQDVEYTLAGMRALVVGRERTGHEEVWFHPFRAVSRWSLAAAAEPPERADSEAHGGMRNLRSNVVTQVAHYRIQPGLIQRWFHVGERTVEERATVAPDMPAALAELRPEGASPVPTHLVLTLESDLRLMWPYSPYTPGRLSYVSDGGAVGLQAETGEWLGLRIEPAPAVLTVADASDAERSRARITAELELSGPVRILLVGATSEERPPMQVDPAGWAARCRGERKRQREEGVRLQHGRPELAEAVEWAKWRLSTYRVHVPGLGTSLVAGYARSRPTRFGDGRPGYAWFFSRDAVWTALGCLAAGQHEAVREVLEFLGRQQDITGKILHECTTSGVVHYDAADSTPLYLLLAARYLAATGDEKTLRREWPHILRAYEFCLSTDTDGDGLIENTGVGHAWVEFGSLGDHHVSLYLAGVWAGALAELEVAAQTLGEYDLADELAFRAASARSSIELSLYDPIEGRYAHGRRADGSLNMSETVMTAVPLLLGVIRPERCERWLDRVASDDFTAPWGVRLVPRSDPAYRPDGYHAGAVWPLYTGWVSLAEARAGRAEAARRHWESVARLYRAHAPGAWPEVLHGDEPRDIGVTADQAWSAAMPVLSARDFTRR